jgi:hypothetical protein
LLAGVIVWRPSRITTRYDRYLFGGALQGRLRAGPSYISRTFGLRTESHQAHETTRRGSTEAGRRARSPDGNMSESHWTTIVAGAVGPGRQCGRWLEPFGAERILPISSPTGSEAACTLYFSSDLRVGEPACTIIRGQDKRGGYTRARSRLESPPRNANGNSLRTQNEYLSKNYIKKKLAEQ